MNPYYQDFPHFQSSNTQEAIYRAFLNLYAQSPKVTVRQLCLATPIARSTFYTYYTDIEQLKAEVEDRIISQLMTGNHVFLLPDEMDLHFVTRTFAFVQEHHQVFDSFLLAQTNLDFIEKWKTAIKYNFYEPMQARHADNLGFRLETFAAAVVAAITYTLKHPNETIQLDDISQLVLKILN